MNCSFHPNAEIELNEAITYYNKRQSGLGLKFAKEIYLAIQSILSFPNVWSPLSVNTRRCLINHFPYGIIYQVVHKRVFVIAIMNLNKEPNYWKKRVKKK